LGRARSTSPTPLCPNPPPAEAIWAQPGQAPPPAILGLRTKLVVPYKGVEPEATRALSPPRIPFLAFVIAQRRRLLCRAPPVAFPVVSWCSPEQGDASRKTTPPSRTPVAGRHPYLIAGASLPQRPEYHRRPLEQSRLSPWPLVADSLDEDAEGAIRDCHKHLLTDPVPVPPIPVVNRSSERCRRHEKPTRWPCSSSPAAVL
jgi:hypothetical protein